MLPQALARVSRRFGTPWVSLVVNTGVALLLLWTKSFGYVLNIALVAMFLLYGLHSASLVALPFIRPALYEKAQVRIRPALLAVLGTISFLSMGYLATVTIARDIAGRQGGGAGLALWQLLLLWVLVGSVLYLIGRWEGRRSGFDYKRRLTKEWMEDEPAASQPAARAST
jgi:amino acid transporter